MECGGDSSVVHLPRLSSKWKLLLFILVLLVILWNILLMAFSVKAASCSSREIRTSPPKGVMT